MAESQVQLKREEIVGDEVILTDVAPRTNTESVSDLSNGLPLDESLIRIWNAINNKLYRVVNSVNGRTGVIVLSAKDVGLSNVDNVSFKDIQDWVLEQIEKLFGAHSFKLYESMDSVNIDNSTNDKMLAGIGFFASSGFAAANDNLAYIGRFYWDEGTDHIAYECMPINIISATDASMIYNEKIGDKDYTGGKLGVNIWKDEDALEIYEGLSNVPGDPKGNSGLRINKEKVVPNILLMEGVYGSDPERPGEAEDAWLYTQPPAYENERVQVDIYYDDRKLDSENKIYAKKILKYHDIIVCHFANMYTDSDNNLLDGVSGELIGLHTGIGVVTRVDKRTDGTVSSYEVRFYSTKPRVGYGLKYYHGTIARHYDDDTPVRSPMLRINTPYGVMTTTTIDWEQLDTIEKFEDPNKFIPDNISGFVIRPNADQRNEHNYESPLIDEFLNEYINTPNGPLRVYHPAFNKDKHTNYDGIAIGTDASISIMPIESYAKPMEFVYNDEENPSEHIQYNGCRMVRNWKSEADFYFSGNDYVSGSMIGINLDKALFNVETRNNYRGYEFSNLSGLRINPASKSVDLSKLGVDYSLDDLPEQFSQSATSGGLAINVGKFLKIEPGDFYLHYNEYYDGGKLTINCGDGLGETGENKLGIFINEESGLGFIETETESGDKYKRLTIALQGTAYEGDAKTIKFAAGLRTFIYDEFNTKLSGMCVGLAENSGISYAEAIDKYAPVDDEGNVPEDAKYTGLKINCGPGLEIKDNKLVPNIGARIFSNDEGPDDTMFGLKIYEPYGVLGVHYAQKSGLKFVGNEGALALDVKNMTIESATGTKYEVESIDDEGNTKHGTTDVFPVEYDPVKNNCQIKIGRGLKLILDESEVPEDATIDWSNTTTG